MSDLYFAFRDTALEQLTEPALVDSFSALTYQAALERVTRLASLLGADARHAVLITGKKTNDTVLWQLACSKVGHVFMPCDVATPPQRLNHQLAQVQPRWLVDDSETDHSGRGFQLQHKEASFSLWARADARSYHPEVHHLISSSGSTGEPKIILLKGSPVVDVVREQARQLGLGPGSRFAWVLSPSFDASLSDIYATLLSGACLYVCDISLRSVRSMQTYLAANDITHTDISPSVLPLLKPAQLPGMRALVFGGELAQPKAIAAWLQPGVRLFNAYGPTEATICTHFKEVDVDWGPTNFGTPLPGVECLIETGGTMAEAQPGARGELIICGSHLALGYDNVELTGQKFSVTDGRSTYRTGDLVRVDSAGDYHFIGRVDRQMKVRGVLVCPEEVETLALKVGCREAALRLEDDRLVLHYSGDISEEVLRELAECHLLSPMRPQRYLQHEQLEKSLSGKVKA